MSQQIRIHGPGCIYNTLKAEQLARILRGEAIGPTTTHQALITQLVSRAPHCQNVTVVADARRFAVTFATHDSRFKTDLGDTVAATWFKHAGGHAVTCELI